ncbi:hypothetical protein DESUT3_03190 [Desulfuromonas versatilis]|uniref:tRNA(Ile2) 2-agmatinylcytidine synthetase n=1 Tax=Desulfuromonas versatilis TaxID=2802975 RepID=A0ABN6DT45_9BACT|nr:hypothetical protein [Desulfuromonas versatilis]BCR03250.1 hypothetical protein DESUT3_03190 [Desulfuromonas versatilis]
MNILISLDDTDNLESRGTGALASQLAGELEGNGWGRAGFVTRHQLLVHPDIPYTSHNSAMCFPAELSGCTLEQLIEHAARFLERESAPGSDPGLCVAVPARLGDAGALLEFGRAAKTRVLDKAQAYRLARELGIHLSEHGGSGQGVVGALAGAGLRLGGNDGRLKGRLHFRDEEQVLSVAELCAHPLVDGVQSLEGLPLAADARVWLGEKVKTVLLGGRSILPVVPRAAEGAGAPWQTCPRQQLKGF